MINFKNNPSSAYVRSILELVLAAFLWGASFILVRWALEDFSTSTLIFWRYLIAFLLGEGFFFLFYREEFKKSHSDRILSAKVGFFLGLSLILQTHGLHFTTATNSSFITSMYVILVPVVGAIFFRQKISLGHFLLGFIAFIGMGLLLNLQMLSEFKFNGGDLLTLGCALAAAFHIVMVGRTTRLAKSSFRFNNYQNFWTLVLVMPFLFFETLQNKISLWPAHVTARSLGSLLGLSIFVSILGFFLQIRAQKYLSTTTASLLCLLEAPFAFSFAILLLNEKINFVQLTGISIILLSSIFSVYMDRPKNRNNQDTGPGNCHEPL